jgi:predicted TPR repeat methyltransferase
VSRFVRIPKALLRSVSAGRPGTPTLYHTGPPPVRLFFRMRLEQFHRFLAATPARRDTCLDFGGGGGVLLPTLAGMFAQVTCIDRETAEAELIVAAYRLDNVRLVRADVLHASLEQAPFDVIVAADVLEHFRDLAPPIAAISRWLAPGGLLITSLPSESGFYRALRRIFRVTPPPDHFHNGEQVEAALAREGFTRLRGGASPLGRRMLPLFLFGAWSRT